MENLPYVKLVPRIHGNGWKLFIEFDYNNEIHTQLRKLKARWSNTHKNWYLPYTQKQLTLIQESLIDLAFIDTDAIVFEPKYTLIHAESKVQEVEIPQEYIKTLMHRRFSDSTFRNYTSQFKKFMIYFQGHDLEKITKTQITEYLIHLIKSKNISTSTQNSIINAIKFYYEKVLNREKQTYWINRPQREHKLPNVLSEEEVIQLLGAIKNLKHLTIATLLYSAGLRRGELLKIKKGDIDPHRKQIRVVGGKGKKDRVTILSEHMLELLNKYVRVYKPKKYLFEGKEGASYSPTSVGVIIKRAGKDAGILKKVTPHVLRHSFATHLMDQGIETRYIQILLGHNSLETTAMYTHVSTRTIEKIISPLDKIFKKDVKGKRID